MTGRKILMIPGPSEADPRVLASLAAPVMAHYGADWGMEYNKTVDDLKKIFKTKDQVIIFPGPGNGGVELVAVNVVEPGDKVLTIENGWFGEILSDIVKTYGGEPIDMRAEYGQVISAGDVEARLDKEKDVKAVFVVQNETSSGVENPIREIGRVARKHGAVYFVDSISSFGGVNVEVDDWGIDVCVGYGSKCLGGIHGAVPIAIGKRIWEEVESRKSPIPSRFMNLKIWKYFIQDWAAIGHPFPTAMPTTVILAMHEAVRLALEEGLENRYRRHLVASKAMREGCKTLGLEPVAAEDVRSKTVTLVRAPEGTAGKIVETMENHFNILIAGGLSKLKGKALRIGTMGVTASPFYVLPTLSALENTASVVGIPVTSGAAVVEASRIFQAG
jgi:aspartate aminotransferase-like enzyme